MWYCKESNKKGEILEKIIEKFNLFIVNNSSPTYKKSGNILDLSICSSNSVKNFSKFEVLSEDISDHLPTLTILNNIETSKKTEFASRIDWTKFQNYLNQNEITIDKVRNAEEPEQKANLLTKEIHNALEAANITFKVDNNNKQIIPVPHELKVILKNFKNEKLKKDFHELSNFNQSSSKHWELLKKIENQDEIIRPQIELLVNDQILTQDDQFVEKFAKNLADTFSDNSVPIFQMNDSNETSSFSKFEYISTDELIDAISKINTKASTGFDMISNKTIKNLPFKTLKSIHSLFNFSLKLGYIPQNWKKAKIIMLYKKNKPSNLASSYRPISLLSCLGKLLEKIVNTKLQNWIETNKLLPECQAGFISNRSTQEQILMLTQSIIQGFNEKKLTGAVLFDLEKAFDKSSHT
ncbi:unnamed protein product, partial [Brachionus calyciflorus]